MSKRLAVIDGDEIVYKAAFSAQRTEWYIKFSEDNIQGPFSSKKLAAEWIGDKEVEDVYPQVVPESEKVALSRLDSILRNIYGRTDEDDHRIYLTGKGNFRFEVATLIPYKGNRVNSVKPVHHALLTEAMTDIHYAITVDGMEADDAMSITSWQHQLNDTNWEVIIATQDKDLNMVPGHHHNPTSGKNYYQPWEEARLCMYSQMLTGDATDNIPGIYRTGPAAAAKLLGPLRKGTSDRMYRAVLAAYQQAYETEKVRDHMAEGVWGTERVQEIARLLWMQQERGQLWVPDVDYYETFK